MNSTHLHHIEWQRFRWQWSASGTGDHLLLAFPGFNHNPDNFIRLGSDLGAHYTVVVFELFYHGTSTAGPHPDLNPIQPDELRTLINQVLHHYGKHTFSVIAYSFGGRLALSCVQLFQEQVEGCFLLAPDGIRFNPGYWFATQTSLGRRMFRNFRNNPSRMIWWMRFASHLGLAPSKAINFYISQVSDSRLRDTVYRCWMAVRRLQVSQQSSAQVLCRKQIKLLLVFGRYDAIIKPRAGKKFAAKCQRPGAFHQLECGHALLEKHEQIGQLILELHQE